MPQKDLLTLMWIEQKLAGYLPSRMEWHKMPDGRFHANCSCTEVEKKIFRPRDELMAVYLRYMYQGL